MGYVIINYGKIKSKISIVLLFTVTMYNFHNIEMKKLYMMNLMYLLCVCVFLYCGTIALILNDTKDASNSSYIAFHFNVMEIIHCYSE